jgi:hypothetical protein
MSASKPKKKAPEIELHPDAWERFTEFVKRIAKAGPQHRTKKASTNAGRRDGRKRRKSDQSGD